MGKRHPGLAMVIAVVLLGAASTAAPAHSDDSDADAPGAISPGAPTDASALEAHRALKLHGYDTTGALHITLPPPARTPESASSGGDGPLQVSFERGMPAEYEGNLSSRMKWVPSKDGTVATQASVTSPGAMNMRMGVLVDLPPEAEIRFFGADSTTTYPVVTRKDIPWKGSEAQTLWSPIAEGQTIGIEIVLPSEESLPNFKFEIDGVLHGFLENGGFGFAPQLCSNQVDAMCRTSRFESLYIGTVGQISYRSDDGGGYICSGTMMNDKDKRHFIPYFLTANHCISSQTEARSIVAQWYFLPATCGDTRVHSRYFRTSFGANMLETSPRQDSSFLVFRYRARNPLAYSGWDSARVPLRHDAFGLHHPSGTRMKYSAGRTTHFKNVNVCEDPIRGIGCNLVANAIEVDWTDGLTEGGSSGSGLFFRLSGHTRLMGVLSGGRGGCTDKISTYGNFRDFFHGKIGRYLNATTAPIPVPPYEGEDPIVDDHPNNCSGGTRVSLPSTTRGSLERNGDVDAFRFNVSRAGELRAETTGTTDTVGTLYRGTDETDEIGRNDDSDNSRNFRIVKDVQPGVHCVKVRGSADGRTGDYSLRVELGSSPPPPPPSAITRFGDLNGDGRDDVLVRHTSGRWYYYAMNGRNPIRGTSGGARLNSDSSWRLAGIGDFNGDGRDDVLVRHTSGRWYYYAMNGRNPIRAASGGARLNSDSSWRLAGIGDLNGDGRDDVLVRHTSGRWYYYAMNGRNPIRAASGRARLNSDSSWRLAGIGDLNGDGRDDVLVRHTSGRWYYYAMNGRNPIRAASGRARLNSDSSWRLAGIGDLNGDGRDDVLVRHTSGRWYYYAMNGRNPIRAASGGARLNSDSSWRLAGIGDLNGDGRDDVLARHTSGRWYYYAMNGRNPIRAASGGARLNSDTKWVITRQELQQSADASTHVLPLLTVSSNEFQRGIVRIINHSERSGTVAIHGVDGAGTRYGPATLSLGAKESMHLDSAELEDGSPSKGLLGGLGDGTGNWRLELTTELDIEPLAYVRNVHGAFTPLHEIARTTVEDSGQAVHHVPLFPSAGDGVHDSQLRLINLGDAVVAVTIGGVDDAGNPATDTVRLTIPGGQTRTLTPQDLETPGPDLEDVRGGLGDGEGNWRLSVVADGDIAVMGLLLGSDTVANLSASRPKGSSHDVPFVPASNGSREGYVRIINHSDESGDMTVSGIDDAGNRAGPVTLSMEPGGSVHLSSSDLASGSSSKGLSAGLGDEGTTWRLVLDSELETEPFALVRSTDGFSRPMHAFVRTTLNKQGDTEHHVPFFTPANSGSSQGLLRVTNLGESSADLTIAGRDDAGTATTTENRVVLTLPAGATRTLTAQELESGGR